MQTENKKSLVTAIILYIVILFFFAILFLRTAWLCDDAYITFRTVDNAVNGYGLRWNVNERVQAYTHPLWMFLHIPFYAITHEMFLTGIFISFTVSMMAIILFIFGVAKTIPQAIISASILGFSRAFIDYSSSGLENPMSHVLLILFFILFLKQQFTITNLFLLSLLTSLSALNRQDCILLYLPALIFAWWKTENKINGFIVICLGFVPLGLWELFSIIYYGFPFPNTAYAKLGTGIAKIDLIKQGVWYYLWTWKRDFITLLVLILALIIPFYRRQKELLPMTLGLLLYCMYILWIGGDFMGGRFFSVPFLLATIIVVQYSHLDKLKYGIPAMCIFIITSLVQPNAPIRTDSTFGKDISNFKDNHGIGDERMFYFQVASLAKWEQGKPMPCNAFADQGRQYRKMNQRITKLHGSVGYRGYFAGPVAHIVDQYALSDPLLARIPAIYRPQWRIGHFARYVPEGYLESAGSDVNKIKDEQLAKYFDYLKIITRNPICSWERWLTIVKMNLGMYQYLIDKDRYQFPNLKKMSHDELQEIVTTNQSTKISVPKYGIEVQFNEMKNNKEIAIELDSFDTFIILFFNNKNYIGKITIQPLQKTLEPFNKYNIHVPFWIRKKGYNALRIFTFPGDSESLMRGIYFN
ncbi:MAG: hypothetical protein LDL53_04895 [Candidatus Hydrogenedens sp.]|nr:hypothetical protein [Candidatus Hydrogenedens sp.]